MDDQDSLVKRQAQQLELISSEDLGDQIFAEDEGGDHGEFTAVRLYARRPETYLAVISLLAEGLGMIRIGRLLHVSPNTVMAVRDREPGSVDIEKTRIAAEARGAARLCIESIIETVSDPARRAKLNPRDLGVLAGILIDKAQLLSGGATARIETIGAEPSLDDFNAWLAESAIDVEARVQGEDQGDEGDQGATVNQVPGGEPGEPGHDPVEDGPGMGEQPTDPGDPREPGGPGAPLGEPGAAPLGDAGGEPATELPAEVPAGTQGDGEPDDQGDGRAAGGTDHSGETHPLKGDGGAPDPAGAGGEPGAQGEDHGGREAQGHGARMSDALSDADGAQGEQGPPRGSDGGGRGGGLDPDPGGERDATGTGRARRGGGPGQARSASPPNRVDTGKIIRKRGDES